MMDLDDLIASTGWTERDLAFEVGVSQPTINRVRTGAMNASLGLALRISAVTSGDVSARDLPMSKQARKDFKMVCSFSRAGFSFD
jgi:DNA-binding XRE family transcriptional regulator